MVFFKSAPNVKHDEKARIEFHLQQLADFIGPDRFKLPMVTEQQLMAAGSDGQLPSIEGVIAFVGEHLSHDVSGIKTEFVPLVKEQCGGG